MPDTNRANQDRLLVRTTTHVVLPEGVPVQNNHSLAEVELAAGVAVGDLVAAIAGGNATVTELPE